MSDQASVDAAEALRIVDQGRDAAARHFVPDDRLLFGTWGVAWAIGFFGLWLTTGDDRRIDAPLAGGVVFAVLSVGAMIVTGVHIGRRVTGVHGRSAVAGRRMGISWCVAFTAFGMLLSGIHSAGASDDVVALLSPVLACTIVGIMYMAGGAMWDDATQFVLGAWIALAAGVAALVGRPGHLLVMSVLGGGGFLVAAWWAGWRGTRR